MSGVKVIRRVVHSVSGVKAIRRVVHSMSGVFDEWCWNLRNMWSGVRSLQSPETWGISGGCPGNVPLGDNHLPVNGGRFGRWDDKVRKPSGSEWPAMSGGLLPSRTRLSTGMRWRRMSLVRGGAAAARGDGDDCGWSWRKRWRRRKAPRMDLFPHAFPVSQKYKQIVYK